MWGHNIVVDGWAGAYLGASHSKSWLFLSTLFTKYGVVILEPLLFFFHQKLFIFHFFSKFFKILKILKNKTEILKHKTTQDFADFRDFCGNFKAKTKTEDEGIF